MDKFQVGTPFECYGVSLGIWKKNVRDLLSLLIH